MISPDNSAWYVGDTKEIAWKSVGVGANVKIEASHDNGATWLTIASSTANDGAYDWTVTGPITKIGRIRVTSISYPSVSDAGVVSIAIRPVNRTIEITSPDNSVWYVGDSEEITWTSKEAGSHVKVEVSRDSGSTWSIIVSSTSNDDAYDWNVTGPITKFGRIRVTSTNYPSVSDTGVVSIANRPVNRTIEVTSPDNSVWYVDGSEEITWEEIIWTSTEAGSHVKIEISRDNGSTWAIIASSTANDGVHYWTVMGSTTYSGLIRVTSTNYPSVSDTGVVHIIRLIPTVLTTAVSSITTNSASGGGSVTSDNGASVTARGVCWNTSSNPTIADSNTTDGTGTGSFMSSITGLSTATTYSIRAYATNSAGTAYGGGLSFTTTSHQCAVCSASPVVLTDFTFDTDCECRDPVSVTIGNGVTFKAGVNIWLIAPTVKFQGESNAEMHSVVFIRTTEE